MADYNGSLDIYTTKDGKNVELYPTSMPGIFYGVKLYSKQCPQMGGYIPPNKDWTFIYDIGDDKETSCLKNDEPYYFDLAFFMGSDYKPKEDSVLLQNLPIEEHGHFKLSGSDGEGKEGTVTVLSVGFTAELKKNPSTCTSSSTLLDEMQNHLAKNNLVTTAQHRGDFDNIRPENSLDAFHLSYDRCRPNVETDVRETSDHQLVVFHDLNVGKMLEPTYDPVSGEGPNDALSNLTLAQVQSKFLVNVASRQPTTHTVPTVDQMLQDYISYNGQSLIYLETKSSSVIIPTALALYRKSVEFSGSNLLKRVIMKVNMAEYPTPDLWNNALINAGIPAGITIMIDPVITPNDASKINGLPDSTFACPAGVTDSKSICAVRAWAKAPVTLAPMVSVLIKDSSDFVQVVEKSTDQGKYFAPTSLAVTNTSSGTVAHMVAVIKSEGKALEVFSPVPDYMLWKDLDFYVETVNDKDIQKDISVRDAFYNNTSSCCYQIIDKRNPTPIAKEVYDYRLNLGWLRDIGANIITADDTDSIGVYFSEKGELDTILISRFEPASFYMQSMLAWQLGYAYAPPLSLYSEKDGYVLWSNDDSYAWTYRPDAPYQVYAAGYDKFISIKRQPDGRVRVSPKDKKTQCLRSNLSSSSWDYVYWKNDCSSPNSQWQMKPKIDDKRYFSLIDNKQNSLRWEYASNLYYAHYWGYVYVDKPTSLSAPYYWKIGRD